MDSARIRSLHQFYFNQTKNGTLLGARRGTTAITNNIMRLYMYMHQGVNPLNLPPQEMRSSMTTCPANSNNNNNPTNNHCQHPHPHHLQPYPTPPGTKTKTTGSKNKPRSLIVYPNIPIPTEGHPCSPPLLLSPHPNLFTSPSLYTLWSILPHQNIPTPQLQPTITRHHYPSHSPSPIACVSPF